MRCPKCFNFLKMGDKNAYCSVCDYEINLPETEKYSSLIMENISLNKIEEEGREAFLSDQKFETCPHAVTAYREAWCKGFLDEKGIMDSKAKEFSSLSREKEKLDEIRKEIDKMGQLLRGLNEVMSGYLFNMTYAHFWEKKRIFKEFRAAYLVIMSKYLDK